MTLLNNISINDPKLQSLKKRSGTQQKYPKAMKDPRYLKMKKEFKKIISNSLQEAKISV